MCKIDFCGDCLFGATRQPDNSLFWYCNGCEDDRVGRDMDESDSE